jgi:hypothetical protein
VRRLSVKYYAIAIFFLLFDLETVLLFIWAGSFGHSGLATLSLLSFLFFMGLLALAFAYLWKQGGFNGGDGLHDDQEGRARWMDPQVQPVPVSVRHGVLRHGVHGGELDALRHRPLRRGAAALHAAAGRSADGRRHDQSQGSADPEEGLRPDVRAEVGDGIRRVRDERRVLSQLWRAAGHRPRDSGRHLRTRLPAAPRRPSSTPS